MCQLRGCDRGGRASAAELALAGGIDVNVGRLFQPADFGVSPDPTGKLYSRENISQRIYLPGCDQFHPDGEPVQSIPRKTATLPAFDRVCGGSYTANSSIANGQVA